MPDFDISKLIIVLIFLGLLVSVQFALKRWNLFGKISSASPGRAIRVTEVKAISKFASASIIECSDSSFLVVIGKNGTSSIAQLPSKNSHLKSESPTMELGQ